VEQARRPRSIVGCLALLFLNLALSPDVRAGNVYYVRQTVGDDAEDGRSPQTAWQHLVRLGSAMHAGDVAYVGPGLYREEILVQNDGTPEGRIVFVADSTGQHTGDPPGAVMVTGADPVGDTTFEPHSAAGVYMARIPDTILGAVEMDGPQQRYEGIRETKEFVLEHLSPVEVVAKRPSRWYYDDAAKVLYVHTSDGRPPATHEMELFRRGNGVLVQGKRYVSVIGFTFRHMGDSGISFFKGSSDCIAADNVSYGSRQGIRVYGATNVLVYGNTLFRNENSGVYFAAQSTNGQAIGNTSYENLKGVRWSSQSVDALCLDNTLFDNGERGIALENVDRAILRRNRVVNNAVSQLLVIRTPYSSENNCWDARGPAQAVAEFFPYFAADRHATLVDYQTARRQDLGSRAGSCGPLPEKPDVHRLHAETTAYAERAREILRGGGKSPPGAGARQWLRWLLGG
jgi:parallel beta-helix repeat protein